MENWLVAIRKSKGLSQKEVAEQVQISQPAYFAIEKEQCKPTVKNAKRIAAVLGFEWTRFYEDGAEGKGE
ncbi:MAG: helix-turn-helix transcriptional regulator [Oscillibacter sp.]|nr:helix-turn-helix transcriptional regulator [Oscillibacter sp.]